MAWLEIVKNQVVYTGTCPKCGYFFSQGGNKSCPEDLPAKTSSHMQNVDSCPMKVKQPNSEELLRGLGAVTTGSAPNLFNVTYGGKKHGKSKKTREDDE